MDRRVQIFGSPDAGSSSDDSSRDRSPSKRQKTPKPLAAASRPPFLSTASFQASQDAVGRASAQAIAGGPIPQAIASQPQPARLSPEPTQPANARSIKDGGVSTESERNQLSRQRSAGTSMQHGKAGSPKQKKSIKRWFCACFGDEPRSAGQQASARSLAGQPRAVSQARNQRPSMDPPPGQTITMQPGHHHLYVHETVSVSFSSATNAAPRESRDAVVREDRPESGAQAPITTTNPRLPGPKDGQVPHAPRLNVSEPVQAGVAATPATNGMQMGLRPPPPRVKTRVPAPVLDAQSVQHQRPAVPNGWASGPHPPPLIRQGGLQALGNLPSNKPALNGSLRAQYAAGTNGNPHGVVQGMTQQLQDLSITPGAHWTLDRNILRSQRDQIMASSERDGPAWRTLQSLDDSLSGLLESHQSITTPSSGHLQGGNRVMSSMRTMSNLSGTASRGQGRTPTPGSLLSTKDDVLDRDSKLLSADWTCDLLSSAPELGREMRRPRPQFEFWAPPPVRNTNTPDEPLGRNVLFSDHTNREQSIPRAPQTPAPVGSTMQRAQHIHSLQPDVNMPSAAADQRGQPQVAVKRPPVSGFHGTTEQPETDRSANGGPPVPGFVFRGARTPALQGMGRVLMATMPHERLAPYAQRQNPYSNAMALRNGRLPAGKAGQYRLGRRVPKAVGSRAAARRSYEPQASRPSTTLSSQGVDGSKLHTALEAVLNQTMAGNSTQLDSEASEDDASGSYNAQAGMRSKRKLIDSGTCEEVISLLQQPVRVGPASHNRRSRDWSVPLGSKTEAREMRQEDMQALHRKQQILVAEAAQAAAEMEADQAAASKASNPSAASPATQGSARLQEAEGSMRSSPSMTAHTEEAALLASQPSSRAHGPASPQWWAFPA